jgi:SAM-dependent methyltransferase
VSQSDSPYDRIARLYDPWSRSVVEDVAFYVEEAVASGGPVVELGVGTGRIAIPITAAGIAVIGVDSSRGMLDVCAEQARNAGLKALLDLRLGDLREPPVDERVPLVICPFRAYLHLADDDARRQALAAAHELLKADGRLIFDVFAPGADDIAATHGRWIEREPGIHERALWDLDARVLTLSVRGESAESTMTLSWLEPARWQTLLREAGFEVEAVYGWFDRRPYADGEDVVFVARRSTS